MPLPTDAVPFPLAAIVFDRDEDPDSPLRAFVEAQAARGLSIGGLLQDHAEEEGCALHDVSVVNIVTGERLNVMQDLGEGASGCRVDPAAIAVAARQLGDAVAARPGLVVANRFGRLESEGGGMIEEIGQAVSEDLPLIVCVPLRFLDAWNHFAGGLGAQLPPRREAIEAWWATIVSVRASAA
jgi:hypothetical protein